MGERLHVLLVEDNEVDRMAFERLVEREDLPYDYRVAASISEARELLATERFDVALLDYMLGDGTAFDLLDAMGDTPSLVITGTGDEMIAVEAMKRGAYDYLVKDPEGNYLTTLPIVVENTLKRWRAGRELAHYHAHLKDMVAERTAELEATSEELRAEIRRRQQAQADMARASEALRESEARYRLHFESVSDIIYSIDTELRLIDISPSVERILGYRPEELIGRPFQELNVLSPACLEQAFSDTMRVLGGEHILSTVYQFIARDGTSKWGEVSGAPLFRDGRVAALVSVARDITARKQAEQERERLTAQVHEQARQMEQILATVPAGVLLLDTQGQVLQANPTAEADLAELAEAKVGDVLTHLGSRPLAELLTSPPQDLWHEVKANNRTFEVIARPVENGSEPEDWVLVINDVTREREIRALLQQQERLAAVGQLAAGIAHDFNNIMAIIVLYAQTVARSQELSQRNQKRMAIINQQAHHASRLIQQILDFSRRAVLEWRSLDLLPLLKEQVKLLERTLPEHIRIELSHGQDEYMVDADPTRMQQMITNLAVNARDAMPQGGTLRIELERVTVGHGKSPHLPETPPLSSPPLAGGIEGGEWIRLTVSDTGTGIPPDVLPHLFEPFFTTKRPGEGSGLGLAQVHGIVGQHGGHIDVHTQVDQGTTFTIYLPALQARPAELSPPDISAAPLGRGQVVLVVEDGKAVRAALVAGLRQLNYHPLEAANGQEALALMKAQGQRVDLVLSDVVMPVMGGVALFHALREREWQVPVVLLTGHPLGEELDELRAQGLRDWLPKPPSLDRLAQAVADALRK